MFPRLVGQSFRGTSWNIAPRDTEHGAVASGKTAAFANGDRSQKNIREKLHLDFFRAPNRCSVDKRAPVPPLKEKITRE